MPDDPAERSKRDALRSNGTFNTHPDVVTDPLFRTGDFFDPRDLVQVKYEMLRRVRVDKQSVSQSASAFGFSRPTFYQAEEDFQRDGLSGLLPGKRGPHQGHKLTPEDLNFAIQLRASDPAHSPSGFGRCHPEALRHNGPSTQHRARTGPAGKKRR